MPARFRPLSRSLTALVCSLALGCPAPDAELPRLHEGATWTGSLEDGDVVRFALRTERGDTVRVRVEQDRVDVTTEITARGRRVAFEDTFSGPDGPETLLYPSDRARDLQLEIRAIDGAGVVRLAVEHLGPGRPRDLALLEARSRVAESHESVEHAEEARRAVLALPAEASPIEVGRLWWALGRTYERYSQHGAADDSLARAEPLLREHGNGWELGPLLNDRLDTLLTAGRLEECVPYFDEAIAVSERVGNQRAVAITWSSRGVWHAARGELSQAVDAYTRAERIAEQAGAEEVLATVRLNLGVYELALGRFGAGIEILEGVEMSLRERGQLAHLAALLSSLGWAREQIGAIEVAAEHYDEAVDLQRELEDAQGLAVALEQRAAFHLSQERPRRALTDLDASRLALPSDRLHSAFLDLREGQALRQLGRVEESVARIQDAKDEFERLAMLEGLLLARIEGARSLRRLGHVPEALRELEAARDLTESRRAGLQVFDHRRAYLAGRYRVYDDLVDLLASSGRTAEAFRVADSARARSLLDALEPAGPATESGMGSPGSAEDLALASLDQRRLDALQRGEVTESTALAEEVRRRYRARERREEARSRAEGRRRVVAAPRSLDEIQRQIDGQTLLLAFYLGEPQSWLFVLDGQTIRPLPRRSRAEIERLAGQVHELLAQSQGPLQEQALFDASAALSEALFEGLALDRPRLAIVADGALHFVPFALLPSLHGPPDAEATPPATLLDHHEIVLLPSASTLVSLRRDRSELPASHEGPTLAIFADPVFSRHDDRLGTVADTSRRAPWRFRRLPASAEEARRLASLFDPGQAVVREGFEAEREALGGEWVAKTPWLHFATHALVDPRYPRQSGLMLSRVDRAGHPRDGLVRLGEIARLDLAAELVVLSACETALGPQVRGEGAVSLANAFFAAGARRLVASLWEVEDSEVTVRLMERFYEGLLAGDAPSAALRDAQRLLRAEGVPARHWAAFLMLGAWDPLVPVPPSSVGGGSGDHAGGNRSDGR